MAEGRQVCRAMTPSDSSERWADVGAAFSSEDSDHDSGKCRRPAISRTPSVYSDCSDNDQAQSKKISASHPGGNVDNVGSATHMQGTCRPCAFFWSPKGCQKDQDCGFCHLCDEDRIYQQRKANKQRVKEAKALAASLGESTSSTSTSGSTPNRRHRRRRAQPRHDVFRAGSGAASSSTSRGVTGDRRHNGKFDNKVSL